MGQAESAAGCYTQLACLSQEKQQPLARDRFLLLAGASACRAGWADLAADCHRVLTTLAPHHQATRFSTVADGLRNEEYASLVTHWERFCPLERAEMLLSELDLSADGGIAETELSDWLRARLRASFADAFQQTTTPP